MGPFTCVALPDRPLPLLVALPDLSPLGSFERSQEMQGNAGNYYIRNNRAKESPVSQ